MRVDIRRDLEKVAKAERKFNGYSIILISDQMVDELAEWSRPVQMMATRESDASPIVEMTFRSVEEPS